MAGTQTYGAVQTSKASAADASYTYEQLAVAAVQPYAKAILASTNTKDAAGATNFDKFALPSQQLALLSDKLNQNNPLAFFSSALQVVSTGVGSVELKWTDESAFSVKDVYGEGTFNDVNILRETLYWNKPAKIAEAMSAYDLAKGTPNVLAERLWKHTVRFSQMSIKKGFEQLIQKDVAAVKLAAADASLKSAVEKGADFLLKLTNAAVKMINDHELSKEDVTIIIDPLKFNELAFAGLLGNRVDQTFAGGQYSVTTVGGFRIISAEMFMPTVATIKLNAGGDKIEATTGGTDKAIAFIGTSDSLVHNMQIVAANTGAIGITNDLGTYLEVADIAQLPKHTIEKGLMLAVF